MEMIAGSTGAIIVVNEILKRKFYFPYLLGL